MCAATPTSLTEETTDVPPAPTLACETPGATIAIGDDDAKLNRGKYGEAVRFGVVNACWLTAPAEMCR
jgi:hypothetical protein